METPETIRTALQQGEWVTLIDFKDTYFHIPIQEQSRKYIRFHIQGRSYQFKALPFGLSTGVYGDSKEVKLMATHRGIRTHQYLDLYLVGESQIPPCLSPIYSGTSKNLSETRLAGEHGEIRAGTQTNLRLRRLPVRPQMWPGPSDTGLVADPSAENTGSNLPTGLSGQAVHVLNKPRRSKFTLPNCT